MDVLDLLAPARGGEITISKEGDETLVEWLLTGEFLRMGARSPAFMRWMFEWFLVPSYTIESKRTIRTGSGAERYDALIKRRPSLISRCRSRRSPLTRALPRPR